MATTSDGAVWLEAANATLNASASFDRPPRCAVDGTWGRWGRWPSPVGLTLGILAVLVAQVVLVLYHYARLRWCAYLSSTGVYGDTNGAWVDESAPIGRGRRTARVQADQDWGALRVDMRRFRLPGIYGPGRSALDRVRAGRAHRIDLPNQIFSRIHVDDITKGIIASFGGPPGVYNLADDLPCSQNRVIELACDLTTLPWPPLQSLDAAKLSPMARGFYAENRRVANGRAKRLLGWTPNYPTYVEGLRACL